MTAGRLILGYALLIAALIAAAFLSIELEKLAGSVWVAGALGAVTFIALRLASRPLEHRAIEEGYFSPIKRSDFAWPTRLLVLIIGTALAIFSYWQLGPERPWMMFIAGAQLAFGVWAVVEPLPRNAEVLADE